MKYSTNDTFPKAALDAFAETGNLRIKIESVDKNITDMISEEAAHILHLQHRNIDIYNNINIARVEKRIDRLEEKIEELFKNFMEKR